MSPPTRGRPGRRTFRWALLGLALAACTAAPRPLPQPAAEPAAPETLGGEVERLDAAEAARLAAEIRREAAVQLAPGLDLRLWAPEQLVTDPIALDVDPQGRVYITQTTRAGPSDIDIRGRPEWMVESITFRSVDDRRNFLRRQLSPERSERNQWVRDLNEDGSHDWRDYAVYKERVHRLQDADGDGLADLSQVVYEGFNSEVTDLAGALMVHESGVYVGAAPELLRLRDSDRDGVLDQQEVISQGYGVHVGFGGHGLSGVTMGPDGRVYWSIGDIGLNVVDKEGRRWEYPNQGAILRANPDGTDFEVFAAGLRNIHEFAFDERGNLITVDNDGDHPGETERLVYVVDGSDSGWRINWQFGKYNDPDNNNYKVWMEEGMYRPRFPGQAAYMLPPLAAYHTGPAGLVYNPGTALSERWRDHFFVSEFTGSAATSKIHAFQLRPRGAGFELARDTVAVRGVLATGMEFGPEGALYIGDWVEGWDAKGRGRIWKLDAPEAAGSPVRAETRALLASTLSGRSERELLALLRHADMRVRQKVQFELAERSAAGALWSAARQREHLLARLHGIWGIGQLARRDARAAAPVLALLRDADVEVRAQAARLMGDVRYTAAGARLVPLLSDSSARVRFFAAEALGRIRHRAAVPALVEMLRADDDRDAYLRHAGTLALARIGDAEPLLALAGSPSRALRVAAVVALRRMRHPGVARFLEDADEYVAAEAARAINDDESIAEAVPALARVLEQPRFTSEPLLRRAINANLRLGTAEAAQRVAAFAARSGAPDELRAEALGALGVWPRPSVLDRVDGSPRGAVQRDTAIARAALAPLVQPLLTGGTPEVRVAVARAAGRLRLAEAAPTLLASLRGDAAPEVRVAALQALHALGGTARSEEAVRVALADSVGTVRMAALTLVPTLGLPDATTARLLATVLGRGAAQEQQAALSALGRLRGPEAQRVLAGQLDQLAAGRLAPELQLDVMEAVDSAAGARALQARLERFRAARPAGNPMAQFAEALQGGHPSRGRQVVLNNPAGQCTRCHALGERGPEVGPNLRQIGARLTREQLLEALVDPSARIAPGFGLVSLTLRDGQRLGGTLREETATHLVVQTGSGETRQVAKSDVARRTTAASAMPPMGHLLSRRELRDVVEYLTTLR